MTALCLTFDVDWAADFVLEDLLARLRAWGVPRGTFFVTHETPLNAAIRQAGFELGVHPNFNPLFDGGATASADTVIAAMQRLVPGARCVRSHGLTRNGGLSQRFLRAGYTHESSLLLPLRAGNRLRAFEQPPGLIQVPFGWGDHDHLVSGGAMAAVDCLDLPGLKVFNFHPIHVYLNSDSTARYEAARPHLHERRKLETLRHRGDGVADLLQALVARARREDNAFLALSDIGPGHD